MFTRLKQKDELFGKFRAGVKLINEYLNSRGHTPFIDREIERFEREVMDPLDRICKQTKGGDNATQ